MLFVYVPIVKLQSNQDTNDYQKYLTNSILNITTCITFIKKFMTDFFGKS